MVDAPEPAHPDLSSKSRRNPHVLYWIGIGLCTGPIWGVAGTVIAMTRAFNKLGAPATSPSELAQDIHYALLATFVGLILALVGVPMVIAGRLARRRAKAKAEAGQRT